MTIRKHLSATPSVGKSLGNAASFSIRVVLCFSSDPCEFFRVDNDANRLNLPILHIHGQDGEGLTASADDQGGLTVDFLELNTSVLWPKALRPQAKPCDRITPDNRTQRGPVGVATAVRAQGDP